jgi:DNA repair protein RecO (recombination protein O)
LALTKTEAIILRQRHFGTTSLIFTLYTKDYGRIEALAKGIKKRISLGEGGMEVFSRAEIIYYERESHSLRLLSHWYQLNSFKPLRRSPLKLTYASYVIELVDRLIHGEEKNEDIYNLLLNTLHQMENELDPAPFHCEPRLFFSGKTSHCSKKRPGEAMPPRTKRSGININTLIRFFELKLIGLLGYGLEPVIAANRIPHPSLRGQSPRQFQSRPGRDSAISPGLLSLLRFLEKTDFRTLSRLKISSKEEKQLKIILQNYLKTFIGNKPLHTLDVIEKLEKSV